MKPNGPKMHFGHFDQNVNESNELNERPWGGEGVRCDGDAASFASTSAQGENKQVRPLLINVEGHMASQIRTKLPSRVRIPLWDWDLDPDPFFTMGS